MKTDKEAVSGIPAVPGAAKHDDDTPQQAAQCRCCDDMLTPPMLIGRIARMHMNLMRNTEPAGSIMTQNSCRVLVRTLAHESGISQLELARRTGLKPPTVSVALGKMELGGYIRREASETDGREVRVYLTDAGRELEASTLARLRDADAIAMRDVTPEEAEELRRILLKIKNSLAENENTSDPGTRKNIYQGERPKR